MIKLNCIGSIRRRIDLISILSIITVMSCSSGNEIKLMTVDPGHFHAALVQKQMYNNVSPEVSIFAPEGADLDGHMALIDRFNSRDENPTSWSSKVYTGADYFEQMLSKKPGNVMVVAGNNAKKTDYIYRAIDAGIDVLADKPMVITPEEFPKLESAFKLAEERGVLLYDIMTERHEITTMLQRKLSQNRDLFGTIVKGSEENPAITKESVHHFFKYVSGAPLKRPAWFFDVSQEGDGMVDVGTHLVDLIQWEAFPDVTLKKDDVEIVSASRWPTDLTKEMFKAVTKSSYPSYLEKNIVNDTLKVYSNGEINYTLKGVHAKVSVIWNFKAPEGAGDTHYSIMRGTKCNLIIQQGAEEKYKPTLYITLADKSVKGGDATSTVEAAVKESIGELYRGISVDRVADNRWRVNVPQELRLGHESHFGQVTAKYLRYLKAGKLPEWEVPNMIVKYYTTTEGLKAARGK